MSIEAEEVIAPRSLLVVDDDAFFAPVLCRLLRTRGFQARHAVCTAEAEAAVREAEFSAILLDIVLGPENGWETLARIHRLSRAPVLMMSGGDCDSDMNRDAQLLGAQGVIAKPFEIEELLDRLTKLWAR